VSFNELSKFDHSIISASVKGVPPTACPLRGFIGSLVVSISLKCCLFNVPLC